MRVIRTISKNHAAIAALSILAGCSGGTAGAALVPSAAPQQVVRPYANPRPSGDAASRHIAVGSTSLYVYVSNRTAEGSSELVVYDEGAQNPAPIRTIEKNLVDVAGVAVGSSGDLFVANGSGGDVLEYAPGAASVVRTYSKGLADPSDVAVANGTLYVADRGNAANGYTQQIVEYPVGNGTPSLGVAGIGSAPDDNQGLAIDPTATKGTFFASAGTANAIPFAGGCSGSSETVGNDVFPTLWVIVPLSNNVQAPGLAFDASGKLYASDPCNNDVAIYSDASETWTYAGKVPGTFDAPLFLTIDGQYLAVPSSGSTRTPHPGYVSVIDLTENTSPVTITNGLEHPVGAAVGPKP